MLRRAPFESHLRALRTHVPAAGRSISSAARAAGQRCASVNGPRFPITAPFNVKGHQIDTDTVLEALRPLITDERAARIERAVSLRTFNVLPIVEGAYDMGAPMLDASRCLVPLRVQQSTCCRMWICMFLSTSRRRLHLARVLLLFFSTPVRVCW